MSLYQHFRALRGTTFIRSAGVLVGGTAVAQALTILALPILTRLYSPDEFNLLAVYVAVLTILTAISCLRLEIAIPLPEDDAEAANLLALAVTFTTLISLISALVIMLAGESFFLAIGQSAMQPLSWLFPVGIWLAGNYAAFQNWSTRKKKFSDIARTRMFQSGSGLTTQLLLGWAGMGSLGLIVGHVLMSGAGAFNLALHAWKDDRSVMRAISLNGMRAILVRYRRFPQYSTWESLANNAAMQVPVILIAALAVGPDAGLVLLATRAIGMPVTLVGGAIGQVYLSRAPEEMRKGRLPQFTTEVLRGLSIFMVGPIVIIATIAPIVFSFVFGEEWRRAGELVAWMTPWFVLKLLSSPLSMVMHVKMHQLAMLATTATGLVIRILGILAALAFNSEIMAEVYAISSGCFYLLLLVVVGLISELPKATLAKFIGISALSTIPIITLLWRGNLA